jgi:RNA polymerase sigma-70 factor (ECF subfamily)
MPDWSLVPDQRPDSGDEDVRAAVFATTHWSVVLAAGQSDSPAQAAALEKLCRAYWYPLYAYIRRRGHAPEDAQDLTQEFFLRLIEKQWLNGVSPEGARFRSYMLTMVKGFLANAYDRAQAAKRGGGRVIVPLDPQQAEERFANEPATTETPESIFERRWALAVLDEALGRLRIEAGVADKVRHFEQLQPFLSREPDEGEYATLAAQLGLSTGAIGVAVHRLRQRYRETLRATVADTLSDPSQVDEELRHVFAALRG